MDNINDKFKETKTPYSVYRIHKTDIMKKIGFGDKGAYFETTVFYNHIKKNGYKSAIIRKSHFAASQFREVNKGYPRGFYDYRTFNPTEQIKRHGKNKEEWEERRHSSDVIL